MPHRNDPATEDRAARVEELRRRYLDGTLDEVLIPDAPDLEGLLTDLFPRRRRRPRPS